MKRKHDTCVAGNENSCAAANVRKPLADGNKLVRRPANANPLVTVSSGTCQLKASQATPQAGTTRQQSLTAHAFISALGCSEHVQLALARFHHKHCKPCDIDTAIASIYAMLQRAQLSVHELGTVPMLACLWLLDAYHCQYNQRLSSFCRRFLRPLDSPICAGAASAMGAQARMPLHAPATPTAGRPQPGHQQEVPLQGQPAPGAELQLSCCCVQDAHKCPRLRAQLLAAQLDILNRCGWSLHLDTATVLSPAAAALRATDRPPLRQTTLLSRLASRLVSSCRAQSGSGDSPAVHSSPGGGVEQQYHIFSGVCDSIRRRAERLTQRDNAAAGSYGLAVSTPQQQQQPPRRQRLAREAARLAASSLDGPHWAWSH